MKKVIEKDDFTVYGDDILFEQNYLIDHNEYIGTKAGRVDFSR